MAEWTAPSRSRLIRPLAQDDERAAFWLRHVQVGVVQSELGALLVAVYALLAGRPATGVLLVLCVVVAVTSPAPLALPLERIVRSPRGALFFYAWSLTITSFVAAVAILDGGAGSPLVLLLFLPMTYVGLAYPPLGVALMGAMLTGTYLAIATTGAPPAHQMLLMTGTLVLFTWMSMWTSRNQWQVYERQQQLADRLTRLASVDPLTACLNRAGIRSRLVSLAAQAGPMSPLTVCVLDLDGFKHVNDRHGHRVGDAVLVQVAGALHAAVRRGDLVGRLGGDEFAVLLPGACAETAALVVERLLAQVREAAVAHGVTASAGVVTARQPELDVDQLLERADVAMYEAKRDGRGVARQGAAPG